MSSRAKIENSRKIEAVGADLDLQDDQRGEAPQRELTQERICLLVLGMHRSGTSALTRVLSIAGAKLPQRLLGANEDNEAGHWEPSALVEYHDRLLSEIGSSWHDWRGPDFSRLAPGRSDSIKREIAGIVAEDFPTARLFALKDPRICRLAPLVVSSLAEASIKVVPVLTIRNPLDVYSSLKKRASIWPPDHTKSDAALLWLRHVLDAEAATRGLPRAFVNYDALITDWRSTIARVVEQTGITPPYSDDEIAAQVEEFLTTDLRHHTHSTEDVLVDPALQGWIGDAYAALRVLELAPNSSQAQAELDAVRSSLNQALPMLTALFDIEKEARRTDLARANAQLGEAQSAHAQMARQSEQLQADIATREQESAELRAQLTELQAANTAELERVQRLESDIEARQQESANLHTQLAESQSAHMAETELVKRLEADIAAREQESTELRAQLAELQAANAAELERGQRLESDIEARQQESANLHTQLAQLQSAHMAEIKLVERLEADIAALEQESAELRAEIAGSQAALLAETERTQRLEAASKEYCSKLATERAAAERAHAAILEATETALRSQSVAIREDHLGKHPPQIRTTDALRAQLSKSKTVTRRVLQESIQTIRRQKTRWPLPFFSRLGSRYRIATAWLAIRRSGLFDQDYYRLNNPDVAQARINLLLHYIVYGAAEGRNPSAVFNTNDYLAMYPDVARSGMNPLLHYAKYGRSERRTLLMPPSAGTDNHAPALIEDTAPTGTFEHHISSLSPDDKYSADGRPRILILPAMFAVGGVERNTLAVIQQLSSEFRFVIVTNEEHTEASGCLLDAASPYVEGVFDLARFARQSEHMRMLTEICHRMPPDLVWVCNGSVWYHQNIESISSLFRDVPIVDQQIYDNEAGWVQWVTPHYGATVSRMIAINSRIRSHLQSNNITTPDRIDLIYPAIDLDRLPGPDFESNPGSHSNSPRRYGLVGRLTEQKRPFDFIEVARIIGRQTSDIEFLIVGDGPLSKECDDLIASTKLTNIRRQPFVDDIGEIYDSLSGIVFVSAYEGLPVVMLEAIACGTPVLSTDVGDIRQVSEELGGGCVVIDDAIGDPEEIARCLGEFDRNIDTHIADAKRNAPLVRKRFSAEVIASSYIDCWTSAWQASAEQDLAL